MTDETKTVLFNGLWSVHITKDSPDGEILVFIAEKDQGKNEFAQLIEPADDHDGIQSYFIPAGLDIWLTPTRDMKGTLIQIAVLPLSAIGDYDTPVVRITDGENVNTIEMQEGNWTEIFGDEKQIFKGSDEIH